MENKNYTNPNILLDDQTSPVEQTLPIANSENPLGPSDSSNQGITQPPAKAAKPKFSLAAIIGIILFLLLAGGAAASFTVLKPQIMKLVSKPTPTPTPTTFQTPTRNPTANWKMYKANDYSINYPPVWKVYYDSQNPSFHIYDPSSNVSKDENGNDIVRSADKFIDITEIKSNLTPVKYVDEFIANNPAYNGVSSQRKSILFNGLAAETLYESGEGSRGYDIDVSNGEKIFIINIPTSYESIDGVTSQILSTFKFTDNKTSSPTPSCMKRPACLDATPRCMIPEPASGWCP